MSRIVMHIDINQFFAAATCLLEPELKGKPLIIAREGRRGIVSTASYEARNFGIHSAMPTYRARELCPHVIVRTGNYAWYSQKSHEFFDYFKAHYTARIEQVSVDECYADMTDLMKEVKDPRSYLQSIQNDLLEHTKLGASIGLGPTRFLAKMASDYKKPLGITIIRKKDIAKMLYPLPIQDFWGIGKRSAPRLKELGIRTIGDFAKNDSSQCKRILGKFYDTAKAWIRGEGDDSVNPDPFDPKSISSASTFMYDTNDYEEIRKLIEIKARDVSETAKKDRKIGRTITLILKDGNFRSITRSTTIEKPTAEFVVIYTQAINLFDRFFTGQMIRLAGVGLSQLMNQEDFYVQISLFDQEKNQKECATRLLVNQLNRKANKDLFIIASKIGKKE